MIIEVGMLVKKELMYNWSSYIGISNMRKYNIIIPPYTTPINHTYTF